MILDKIIDRTKINVEKNKNRIPIRSIQAQAIDIVKNNEQSDRSFKSALLKSDISFICEIKKASPSKGIISQEFKYKEIASLYETAGVNAISVITEPDFFMGKPEYLKEIREIVSIPILRKDFIIDIYQIYESKVLGADAILLICAVLDIYKLKDFIDIARLLKMDCLVEIHNEKEADMAIKAGAEIIGVNNRNLKDFTVDINNSINLKKVIPQDKVFVAESGIKTKEDIDILRNIGTNAVLIGEELMKSKNIKEKFSYLRGY
jgi:indole-3-glycerol phosphate synthase